LGANPGGAPYWVIVPDGVIFPIAGGLPASVNHRLPSGPAAMPIGWLFGVSWGEPYWVIAPVDGLIIPIRPGLPDSVNHRFPSGPAVMPIGWLLGGSGLPGGGPGWGYSVIAPEGVIFPIAGGLLATVNQTLPSGPAVMPSGSPVPVTGNSLSVANGVPRFAMRAISWAPGSVSHSYPPATATPAAGLLSPAT
jgi:hypothetical protein